MTGSAGQKRVPIDFFAQNPFPLSPLPEQRRIVARINQLMGRCDDLEKLRNEREQKRRIVHTAAIKRLLDAASSFPRRQESSFSDASHFTDGLGYRLRGGDSQGCLGEEMFADAWQFITQHFNGFYSVKENVTELRKAILQLAVMGKLVPQDSNDPPANKLLKEIQSEKQRLVKEEKIKVAKPLPPIKPEEMPYELPEGWEWVRLGALMPEYQNGISKRIANIGRETTVLRLADIIKNEISLTNTRSIRLTENERSQYLLENGDILITRVNGSVDIAGSFICVRYSDSLMTYCDHFIRMRLPKLEVNIDYIHIISKSFLIRRQIEERFVTTAGQKAVNQNHVSTLLLPLPPLPEQHRIVAKVDQLMALCDALESQIDTAYNKQTALLNALMAQM